MKPSFENVDLLDHAAVEVLDSPESRTHSERLPDVAGEFFQVNPPGGREVLVRGVLASEIQVSADLANADLKAKARLRQGLVGSVGTYCGTDSQQYPDSLLLEYRQLGGLRISPRGAGFQALGRVVARLLTQP